MEKNENEKQESISFWKTASDDLREVKKWPQWMQSITLNATTASTGCFIQTQGEIPAVNLRRTTMEEIKPCPFCGTVGELRYDDLDHHYIVGIAKFGTKPIVWPEKVTYWHTKLGYPENCVDAYNRAIDACRKAAGEAGYR